MLITVCPNCGEEHHAHLRQCPICAFSGPEMKRTRRVSTVWVGVEDDYGRLTRCNVGLTDDWPGTFVSQILAGMQHAFGPGQLVVADRHDRKEGVSYVWLRDE